jgi:hypothetical protein
MTKYFTIALLFALLVYGLREAWPLIVGPSLSIDSPSHNAPFPSGIVVVRGKAIHTAQLILNGAPVLREGNGDFSATLTFPHGNSLLTFIAADRFGRRVTATRSIFVP